MKKKELIYAVSTAIVVIIIAFGVIQLKGNGASNNEDLTAKYFETIQKDNDLAKLSLFCSLMPKGGDIHNHYSGAMYTETYLDWAQSKGMKIDLNTLMLTTGSSTSASCISIDSLKKNSVLYRSVLNLWSDMDFSNYYHIEDQPDQHFFNTFSYFGNISAAYYKKGLLEIKERAKKENIQYIETMLMSPSVPIKFGPTVLPRLLSIEQRKDSVTLVAVLDSLKKVIVSNSQYKPAIQTYIDSIYSYHKGIDDGLFSMRFQSYVSRGSNPDALFSKLYGCFDAVAKDKSNMIVAVNIVSPENGIVSMRDYWLHMQMFAYLKKLFPSVKTSMHAGELCLGLVKPEDLTFHVSDAINIACANRIGHGVDIPYEKNAPSLLKKMREKSVAVEINLTSNEFILGVKGKDHPVKLYFDAGVPIVVSTDDAGVSRNNLSSEYVKLSSRYSFSYKQIKTIVYNSIKYSFMTDKDKALVNKNLEKQFSVFESIIASNYTNILK